MRGNIIFRLHTTYALSKITSTRPPNEMVFHWTLTQYTNIKAIQQGYVKKEKKTQLCHLGHYKVISVPDETNDIKLKDTTDSLWNIYSTLTVDVSYLEAHLDIWLIFVMVMIENELNNTHNL